MGGEFQFFDIIILAMIAGFLVLRLRRVLGRRDGHENNNLRDVFRERDDKTREDDNVVHLPDRTDGDGVPADDDDPVAVGVRQVHEADPGFVPDSFLEGARGAFEMILNAFVKGDRKTLKNLLSPDVFKNFDDVITERERNGEVLDETLVGVRSASVVEAGLDGRHAVVTVKFVSEQISALRDAEGNIVDGNPNEIIDVTDFWTFSRDTRSSDPNWTLIGTESNN